MTTTTTTTLFNNIIGQDAAKRKLSFFIDGYEKKGHIPHVLFTAPKGTGKTLLAKELARNLLDPDTLKPKAFLELNCATIRNLKQFVEQIMNVYMSNNDITILFDECSELPKDVTMALLTILNPNKNNRNTFDYEGYSFVVDFKKVSFKDNVSKISIVGAGMVATPGVTYKMFRSMADENINILAISTSEIKLSVIINEDDTLKAIKKLHKIFTLD